MLQEESAGLWVYMLETAEEVSGEPPGTYERYQQEIMQILAKSWMTPVFRPASPVVASVPTLRYRGEMREDVATDRDLLANGPALASMPSCRGSHPSF